MLQIVDFKFDVTKTSTKTSNLTSPRHQKKISNLTSSRCQLRFQIDIKRTSNMTSNSINLISSRHQTRLQICYHQDIKLELKFDIE